MPNDPNGPMQSGGPQAYRPASPDLPDIPLAEVETPAEREPPRTLSDPSQQVVTNPDGTNPFGPDAPNIREEEPKAAQGTTRAQPPPSPAQPLQEDQIAPDET